MSYTFKIRFKNKDTDTNWTTALSASEDSEGAVRAYELLEDTDLVADLKEIADSLAGIDPFITWTEKMMKVTFEDVEDDECLELIQAFRSHMEELLDAESEDPEEV